MNAYGVNADAEPWMEQGNCLDVDPEMFFPAVGTANAHAIGSALAVCARCPVKLKCLTYAMENGEHGIWGGTTEQQRALRRKAAA